LDSSERRALLREAALIRQLLGSGVTALGRASYAEIGEYYIAFFGLSTGLERLAKLIVVTNYAISNGGQFPKQTLVSKYGHNLKQLADTVDQLTQKQGLNLEYPRPATAITAKMIECLHAFADANRGRYANFATLGDPNLGPEEPIKKWWKEVAEAILKEHYDKDAEERDKTQAKIVEQMLSPAIVFQFSETGGAIHDVFSGSIRSGRTYVVQQFGRYYALTIVRWLADIFSKLASEACYAHKIDAFFGVEEFFRTYRLARPSARS
jgi:hypothetical protein